MERRRRKSKRTAPRSRPARKRDEDEGVRVGRRNVWLFVTALTVIVLGFITLGLGSTTISTILLVVGYLVLVPWAILARPGRGEKSPGSPAP